ncbi:MAG: metal-dependent transcriptional regulator [Candidatus Methanomethylophilaceae archaeon]|nr:metal-dependent transcriptional regulator [Candidatus Methanomethylophilaceae archaeon]
MSSENREDYLINILRLTEGKGNVRTSQLASYMNVAPASVTEMLRVLADAGYVNYVKYQGVSLTPEGLAYARNIRRKHHVLERFLVEVLGIDHENAHEQACQMEHSISDESINRICRMIGTKVDHDCTTCDNPCDAVTPIDVTAASMKPGDSGTVSHLKGLDGTTVKKLVSMGFIPGHELRLDSEDGDSLVFSSDGNTIAIDRELASMICIETF